MATQTESNEAAAAAAPAPEQQQQQQPQQTAADNATAAGAGAAATQQQGQQQQQQQQQPYQSASLYVGDLAPDVTEALLFDIFNAVGPVASIRVCRDAVTRRSLGYAYVNFNNHTDAERALDTMNYTLIKGVPCRIMWSHRDPSLRKTGAGNVFVKNLDPSIDNKALYDTFSLFGDILSCKVVTGRDGRSKGYGFVHFETAEAAEEAISKINGMLIAGREVYVGKFIKNSERPGVTEWTNVYVKNIPTHWNKQRLEDEFGACGKITSSTIMVDEQGNSKGFGFVDFADHEAAKKAVETLNEKVVLTKLGEETGPEEPEEPAAPPAPELSEAEKEKAAADAAAKAAAKEERRKAKQAEKDERAAAGIVSDGSDSEDGSDAEDAPPKKKLTKTQVLYVSRAQKKHERERELAQKFEQLKIERMNKYQGINVFIKNLSEEVDDDMLRREFMPFGTITSARVMRDTADKAAAVTDETGKTTYPSKGFGFVCFSSAEEATKAVTEMNGKMIAGKPVYVALAQRKEARRAQLEAHHSQRVVGMGGRGMGPQAPMYGGAPLYFQAGMGGPGAPGMMPGAGMRGMGGLAYFQQPMMAPQMGGMGNGAMGMGMGMARGGAPMMPRGMAGPMGAYGARPGAFPPNVMYSAPGPQGMAMGAMGGMGGMGMMGGPGGAQAGRTPRRNTRQNTGTRQPRVPGAPMGVPGMPGMVMPGGMPGAPRVGQPMYRQPGMGEPMPGGGMPMGAPEPLTAAALANATGEQQKNMIGERLYPLIHSTHPQLAGKITGMLLEMDNPELLNLIESPEALRDKIDEALSVLEAHQAVAGEGGGADGAGAGGDAAVAGQ